MLFQLSYNNVITTSQTDSQGAFINIGLIQPNTGISHSTLGMLGQLDSLQLQQGDDQQLYVFADADRLKILQVFFCNFQIAQLFNN